jgi:hypothetical protein
MRNLAFCRRKWGKVRLRGIWAIIFRYTGPRYENKFRAISEIRPIKVQQLQ